MGKTRVGIALFVLGTLTWTTARAESEAAAPPRVTFDDAVARALAQNPNFALAAGDVARAQALVRQARAGYLPSLAANAVYTKLDTSRVRGDQVLVPGSQLNANLTLAIPVLSAQRWSQKWRAEDNLDLAHANADDVRRQIAVATGRAYLTVLAQHRLIQVSEDAVRNAEAHFRFARDRFTAGTGTKVDVLRSNQDLSTAQAQLAVARGGLTKAQEALGVLMASNAAVDTAGDPVLTDAPASRQAGETTAEKRSDIAALQERSAVAQRSASLSWADYLPLVSVLVQPFLQTPETQTTPAAGWQAQIVLSLPLYEGGLRYGQQDERVAIANQAKVAIDGALRQAKADVRAAFESVRAGDEALKQTQSAADLAHQTYQLTETSYKAGATNELDVIDAQRRARDADSFVVIAEDAARQARLDLLASSGKFP